MPRKQHFSQQMHSEQRFAMSRQSSVEQDDWSRTANIFKQLEYFVYLIICFAGHVLVLNHCASREDELVHLHLVTDSHRLVPASDKLTDGFTLCMQNTVNLLFSREIRRQCSTDSLEHSVSMRCYWFHWAHQCVLPTQADTVFSTCCMEEHVLIIIMCKWYGVTQTTHHKR